MVDVKLCIIKLDGNSEYRRINIPLITNSTDILSILQEKLKEFYPELNELSDRIHFEFQYEGKIV